VHCSRISLALAACLTLPFSIDSPAQTTSNAQEPAVINNYQPRWWKEAVVYQVYPRSFKDSNGDASAISKASRQSWINIQGLGVNVIWLSPHYDSPTPTRL